jgi:hypothetical protein
MVISCLHLRDIFQRFFAGGLNCYKVHLNYDFEEYLTAENVSYLTEFKLKPFQKRECEGCDKSISPNKLCCNVCEALQKPLMNVYEKGQEPLNNNLLNTIDKLEPECEGCHKSIAPNKFR